MPATPAIDFHSEDINFILKDKRKIRAWIIETAANEGYQIDIINFIFCSDAYLNKINIQYLNHTSYTDIITFQYSEDKLITSDIYISIERVKENAKSLGTGFANELHRVLIHGILHLCGYKDKTKAAKVQMTDKEDFYLSLRPF